MSFAISAVGTRREVVEQLEKANAYGSVLGDDIRGAIARAISTEQEPHQQNWEARYHVNFYGHSGGGTPLSLHVTVQTYYLEKTSPIPDGTENA